MNERRRTAVSKVMSHALRHAPHEYGLRLEDGGWVELAQLVDAVRRSGDQYSTLDESQVVEVVRTSPKNRFEMLDGRVRARYGHSVAEEVVKDQIAPPVKLFHATGPANAARIAAEGLQPMGRQYVHLAATAELALEAGRRKARHPILYTIDARGADDAGVRFYLGNAHVHLAKHIPAPFLTATEPKT